MTAIRNLHRPSARAAAVLLGVLLLLGVGIGVTVNALRTPQWSAGTDVLIRTWTVDSLLLSGQATPVTSQDQADAATVAVSQDVLTKAATVLNDGRTWVDLSKTVTAVPELTSHFVTITATGVDGPTALRTSNAVATSFESVTRDNLAKAAAGLITTTAGRNDPDVVLRSQLLTWSVQPVEVYRTKEPVRLVPDIQTPIALGVVGLAVGALVLLGLYLSQPSIGRGRDAQRTTSLPSIDFNGNDGGAAVGRLVARLRETHSNGLLLVCPVDASSEKAGLQLVEWIREREPDTAPEDRIVLLPEPTGAVLGPSPRPNKRASLVLVVPHGTRREDLRDAVALLDGWRAVDAIVVTR